MNALLFLPYYTKWHYTLALKDYLHNWKIFIIFLADFFSLELLFRTLFSPWERMNEGYKKGFDIGQFFETLVVNILMRMLGFVLRIFTLLIGFLAIILSIILGLFIFLFWLLLPIIFVFLVSVSIKYFFI